jgi:hypothetical protein
VFFTRNPKKLGLHFLFFIHFSTEFTSFSKTQTLFKKLHYTEVPGTFSALTDMPLLDKNNPGKSWLLAM